MAVLKSLVSLEVPTVFWVTVLSLPCTYTSDSWETRTVKPPSQPRPAFLQVTLASVPSGGLAWFVSVNLIVESSLELLPFLARTLHVSDLEPRHIFMTYFFLPLCYCPSLVLPVIILFSYQIFFFVCFSITSNFNLILNNSDCNAVLVLCILIISILYSTFSMDHKLPAPLLALCWEHICQHT